MMKINYILDENNIIKSYSRIPFDENKPYLEVDEETLKKVKAGKTKIINGRLQNLVEPISEEEKKAKQKLNFELNEIYNWLFENDWKINKIALGEWKNTDERWLEYLKERKEKRTKRDEIISLLEKLS